MIHDGKPPDPCTMVRCGCGWRGVIGDAVSAINDVVRCPQCLEAVEVVTICGLLVKSIEHSTITFASGFIELPAFLTDPDDDRIAEIERKFREAFQGFEQPKETE